MNVTELSRGIDACLSPLNTSPDSGRDTALIRQCLQAACDYLASAVAHYDWVGFYIRVGQERMLSLGPFCGEPTDHVLIPFGKGICGQAAERESNFVIQDVAREDNYLSCSIKVKSEIVVPVSHNGYTVGEIDIDSHTVAPFTDHDEQLLGYFADKVSGFIDILSKETGRDSRS